MENKIEKQREEFMEDLKQMFSEYLENTDIPLSDLIRSADLFIDTLKKENGI